jgi:hypothetical protein
MLQSGSKRKKKKSSFIVYAYVEIGRYESFQVQSLQYLNM